jgi:hypothetical protein
MLGGMTAADPPFHAMLSASSALAAMLWLGLKHNSLERPARGGRCPACGRISDGRGCACGR